MAGCIYFVGSVIILVVHPSLHQSNARNNAFAHMTLFVSATRPSQNCNRVPHPTVRPIAGPFLCNTAVALIPRKEASRACHCWPDNKTALELCPISS